MRKKSLAVLLVLAMLLGLFPATALAEEPEVEEDVPVQLTAEYTEVHEGLGSVYDVQPASPFQVLGIVSSPTFSWDDGGKAYYQQLDADSKKVYDAILDSDLGTTGYSGANIELDFSHQSTTITVSKDDQGKLSYSLDDEVSEWSNGIITPAILALVYDQPKLSWLVNASYSIGYTFTHDVSNEEIAKIEMGNEKTFTDKMVTISKETFSLNSTSYNEKLHQNENISETGTMSDIEGAISIAKETIDQSSTLSTTYDKVKAIHDYVCNTVSYVTYSEDTKEQDLAPRKYQTVYSALCGEKTTVCAGYAKAFKVLCDAYNIPCILVSGTGNGEAHMWNYVRMEDSNWYAVDCTWDDSENPSTPYTDFFLVGSSTVDVNFGRTAFSASHRESGTWSTGYTFAYPDLATEKYDPYAISNVALTITAPAAGATPVTTVSGEGYTGTITWKPEVDSGDKFQYNTAYTAMVTLTAEGSYSFKDSLTATVNGQAAQVSQEDGTTTVSYAFETTTKADAPKVSVSGGNTISVASSGEKKALTLDVSGLVEGCNEITWTLSEESDNDNILTLPTPTTGTLTGSSVSLGNLTVAANDIGQSEKSATVKISFSGNESGHYAGLPGEITVTINLAAGETQNAALEISTTDSWAELTYGYSDANTVTYIITNTGNVDATNVTASVSGGVFTVGSVDSAPIAPNDTATVTVTFPIRQDAGTYTDTLTIQSAENPTGVTQNLSQTVRPKELAVTWKGKDGSENDFSWVYTGSEIKPTASVDPGEFVGGDAVTVSVSGGAVNAGDYTATASTTNTNYKLTNHTLPFTITKAARTIPAPTQSSVSKSTVTLSPVTPSQGANDGTVQYGYATSAGSEGITNWQASTEFTGLSPQSTYYFFARVTEGTNYQAATSTSGAPITTSNKDPHTMSNFEKSSLALTYGDTGAGQTVNCSTGGTVTYSSSDNTTVSVDSSSGALTIHKVTGSTPVTITATVAETDTYAETTRSYTISVAPKTLHLTGLTAVDRPYEPSNLTVSLDSTNAHLDGVEGGDTVSVASTPTTGTMTDVNAGENKAVSVATPALSGTAAGNYTLAPITGITVTIRKIDPTATAPTGVTATFGQTLSQVSLTGGTGDGTWSWTNPSQSVGNVGEQTHNVTFTPSDSTNYNTINGTVSVTVSKAASPGTKTHSVSVRYDDTSAQTVPLASFLPADCGTVTIGTPSVSGESSIIAVGCKSEGNNIVFALTSGLTETDLSKTATLTVTVTTENYDDFSIAITVNLTKATTHTITFDPNGGSGSMSAVTVADGASYTLPACGFTAPSGMRFKCWAYGSASGNSYNVGSTMTIGTDVSFYAVWEPIPAIDPTPVVPSTPSTSRDDDDDDDGDYSVSVPSSTSVEGGSISVSPRSADKGDTVSITVRPKTGYVLDKLTVTTRTGAQVELTRKSETRYTFIMPAGSISVQVSFIPEEQAAEMDFADVPESFWAVNEIQWAYDNGFMNGTSAVSFNPGGTVNRQQVWMILARMAGADPASMAEAKAWAVANGISDGTTPTGAVTRQQLVALLYRFAVQNGYDVSGKADLSGYPDAASVASYAADAMSWAVANGIIGGTTQGTLNPAGNSNRAQLAVILWRFYQTTAG